MALAPGTHLGPYEITGLLGAGGMGEVYYALDTTLGRTVAVKTLPAALANDAHRLARFEREAQLLATLNHPHIATIHSLAEHDGTRYLAMELVEGATLAEHLAAGPLPVEESLRLALQIAEALEAAHAKGVVHRDLKPANVMLTRAGQVKVLDFGLAKGLTGERGEATLVASPASAAMTQQGFVLGTAGYMSPEQATGQASDQRADIWAFGVVLYEMLTGATLFQGESVPHVIAEVLKSEPDWRRLPKGLSPRIRTLLERCLAKKPRNRLHAIADARLEIESVLANPDEELVAPRPAVRRPLVAAALAATAVAAALTGWWLRPVPAPQPGVVARFSMPLPADHDLHPTAMIAVSPDGTRIAYVSDRRLYLRNLWESEARPIAGTDETLAATQPAFSPDGQWIAYVHVRQSTGPFVIKRIHVNGGVALPLNASGGDSEFQFPYGLSWPTADSLLFTTTAGVVRMTANGGAREVLVPAAGGEAIFSPQILPDGNSVLFTRLAPGFSDEVARFDRAEIVVQSIGQQDRTVVWSGGSAARYLPSGHLLFVQGTALFAVPFDPSTRAVRGVPVSIVQNVARSSNGISDAANFAVSETGTFAVMPRNLPFNSRIEGTGPRIETTLAWVDRDGREEPLPIRPDDYTMARLSPDGTRAALVIGAGLGRTTRPSIWIYDFRTENLSLLTSEPAVTDGPVWSRDGSRIVFRGYRFGEQAQLTGSDVYSIELATGEVTLVGTGSERFLLTMPWALTPNGETLAVINADTVEDVNLATLSLERREFSDLLRGPGQQSEPSFSPDGAWMASSDSPSAVGRDEEINVRPYPAVARTRIPVGRGAQPVFSRDGSELFFYDGEGVASAQVSYEPALRIAAPRRLFASREYLWGQFGRAWDPDPTGQRFLMIRDSGGLTAAGGPSTAPGADAPRIDVVVNWLAELESRVPVGNR